MADLYTSNYPSSGYASESLMRSELQKIQEAFTKVMSTDPVDGGRVMSADLDLNLNNLLNVATVAAEAMTVEDTPVYDYILTAINAAVTPLLSSMQDVLDQAEASANAAQASATSSEASNVSSEGHANDSQAHAMDAQAQASVAATYVNQANAAATDAENSLNELQVIWMGTRTSHPTIADGADVGTLYYNSNNDTVYFCWATQVFGGEVVGLEWRTLSVDDGSLGTAAYADMGVSDSQVTRVSDNKLLLAGDSPEALSRISYGFSAALSSTPKNIIISNDGLKCVYSQGPIIRSCILNTPYDITSASNDVSGLTLGGNVEALAINLSGTVLYYIQEGSTTLRSINLGIPFNTSSNDVGTLKSFTTPFTPLSMCFSDGGDLFHLVGATDVQSFQMSTTDDITTATSVSAAGTVGAGAEGVEVGKEGYYFYTSGSNKLQVYVASTPNDISTLTLDKTYTVPGVSVTSVCGVADNKVLAVQDGNTRYVSMLNLSVYVPVLNDLIS